MQLLRAQGMPIDLFRELMKRVFAIVVTFNRPEKLKICLSSLISQQQYGLEKIHVIVNSGDAATLGVIEGVSGQYPRLLSFEAHDNVGPAGGFYYGLQRFIDNDLDYAWLMDDDIKVDDHCLDELLKWTDTYEYVYPKVTKASGEEIVSYGWWGVLLSRSAVLRAGLPFKELFYWIEDTEYLQHRLPFKHGITEYRCKTALVEHLHERGKHSPGWYYYYTVRNSLYYRLYVQKTDLFRRLSRLLALYMSSLSRIIFHEPKKLNKLNLTLLGTCHGVFRKLGKTIDPAKHN